MSLSNALSPDDQLLVRYLIGSLPEDETERLDEQSIADDQFAARLSAVENDLVDAYVKGELTGDILDGFKAHYLSSRARRERVTFAGTLLRHQQSDVVAPVNTMRAGRPPAALRVIPQWAWAAAALIFLGATGYLFVENNG